MIVVTNSHEREREFHDGVKPAPAQRRQLLDITESGVGTGRDVWLSADRRHVEGWLNVDDGRMLPFVWTPENGLGAPELMGWAEASFGKRHAKKMARMMAKMCLEVYTSQPAKGEDNEALVSRDDRSRDPDGRHSGSAG